MSQEQKLPHMESSPAQSLPLPEGIFNQRHNDTSKKHGKLERMLALFATGIRLNTFEAKDLGDTCLHSTVSDLQSRHGIQFSREWECVQNRFGGHTRVLRYWLVGASLEHAQAISTREPAP